MSKFEDLYDSWKHTEGVERVTFEERLKNEFRNAWLNGTSEERSLILWFITETRCEEGYDLIAEGMRQSNFPLASEASACLLALSAVHIRLGPDAVFALLDYLARFTGQTGDTLATFENIFRQNGWTLVP